jgi:hypothetical protein
LAAEEPVTIKYDRFSVSVTPKILEHGTRQDVSFGIFYTPAMDFAGTFKLRLTKEAVNEELWEIPGSLVANSSMDIEGFLLPVDYVFLRSGGLNMRGGVGMYYVYSVLNQKGFFDDAGYGGLNAYTNDFYMNAIGPLADISVGYRRNYFYGSFSFGLVPVFYLHRDQTMKLDPFMAPAPSYNLTRGTAGSPYLYTDLDLGIITRYVSFFFLGHYEFTRLEYQAIGIEVSGSTLKWTPVDEIVFTHSWAFEGSVLVPLKNRNGDEIFNLQVGYGRSLNRVDQEAGDPVEDGQNYILFGVRKFWF